MIKYLIFDHTAEMYVYLLGRIRCPHNTIITIENEELLSDRLQSH